MRIVSQGKTDQGLCRQNNEDAFVILSTPSIAAVADGMGGAAAGEVAAGIFIETVTSLFSDCALGSLDEVSSVVALAFEQGNNGILEAADRDPERRGMGCTAELIAFFEDRYTVGHVGDSRTYLYREGQLRQLTRDHSLVQLQIDEGMISAEEARSHARKNVILRALGLEGHLSLDLIRGRVRADDIFLLCSDGLSDLVDEAGICAVLCSDQELEDKVDHLIALALKAGGRDNVTVVLCHALPEVEPSRPAHS